MDGNHGGPAGGRGGGAAHQQQEAEHPRDELHQEHPHGGQPHPGVDAVQVVNTTFWLVLVEVPGSDEANDDTGNCQQMEHGVEQFTPDSLATST